MEQKANQYLETLPVGALMGRYAVPCIISLLVAALYNIVDQIFIANADYLGSYGNAANTVVFPLTVVALAVAVMIGDGACAYVSILLGRGKTEDAQGTIGSAVTLTVVSSLVVTGVYLLFSDGILALFGGTVNEETFRQSREYFFWITVGIPFYMFGQAMNPIIRSDGSPPVRHGVHPGGGGVQHRVRPHLHLRPAVGHDGRGGGYRAGAGDHGGAGGVVSAPHEGGDADGAGLPAAA